MPDLEQALISVWRQTFVDGTNFVEIAGKHYSVKLTAKRGRKQVDFQFDGHELRGLEQNPESKVGSEGGGCSDTQTRRRATT